MNKFISIIAFAALCFTGCKKDIVPPPDPGIGIESTSISPYGSMAGISSLNKVVNDSVEKSPSDSVRVSAVERITLRGAAE